MPLLYEQVEKQIANIIDFSEVHLFLLEAIAEALTEFESMLNQYTMDILCNVDSLPYARVPVSDLLGMRDQVKNKSSLCITMYV